MTGRRPGGMLTLPAGLSGAEVGMGGRISHVNRS